jgi:plastocyanin
MLFVSGCVTAPAATSTKAAAVPTTGSAAPTAPAGAASAVVEVTIEGFAFNPTTIKVAPGTTVRWTQKDSAPHTVTSDRGVFDSKNMNQGQSFTFKFETAGKFDYICSYHPSMKGSVDVQ